MNISKIFLVSAGLALATTALMAQGFGPGMMGGGRGQGRGAACFQGGPMARSLNLTAAQQASLKAVSDKHQAALDAKLKAADEARDAMRDAMRDPAVSDVKVKELHTKTSDAMMAVMLERRTMAREFEAILTPEQKAAWEAQRLQRGPGGRMGRGGRGCRSMGSAQGGCWGAF
jgi:Spy/CpxP family protein refolding chaperone